MSSYRIWCGIDPGVSTGFAVLDKADQRLLTVNTLMIHQAQFRIIDLMKSYPQNIFVHFEDARQRKWFGNSGPEKWKGAGSIMRDCKIWEDFLTDLEIPFRMVAPKAKMTKWDKDYFKQVTGWQQVTSGHSRDAAVLVYGK